MIRRLVHFAALGAILFVAQRSGSVAPESPPREALVLPTARVEVLRNEWVKDAGREPTAGELEALVTAAADEEILIRTALRLGMHRTDSVVRQRLILNMRFTDPASAATDESLFDEAVALGMHRTDPVVRRRLAFVVEQMLRHAGRGEPPSDDELRAWLEAHPERFQLPDRFAFAHIYLSSQRRGERLEADARKLREQLVAEGANDPSFSSLGDPFLLPSRYSSASPAEIEKSFGRTFAESVAALEPGAWSEPIRSPYGLHLVRLEARQPGRAATLDEARDRVRYAIRREREDRAFEKGMRGLRERYAVRVEDGGGAS